MVLSRELPFWSVALWGLRAPTPQGLGNFAPRGEGRIGGYAPPNPAVHFWTPKSEPKNRQNQGFGFLCLIGLYQLGKLAAPEFRSFSNLQSGGQRYSACRPLKEMEVSISACRNILRQTHQKHLRRIKHHEIPFARGGGQRAGLLVRGKNQPARRQAPSGAFRQPRRNKINIRGPQGACLPPVRAFAYFSHEGKEGRGTGAEPPKVSTSRALRSGKSYFSSVTRT